MYSIEKNNAQGWIFKMALGEKIVGLVPAINVKTN